MQLYKLDFPNGKSYIGITSKTAQERFNQHCCKSKNKNPCQSAIQKYGKENVKLTVIFTLNDWELLCLAEQEAIEKFNTFKPNGYNITKGGEGVKGLVFSEQHKKRLSESHKGYVRSVESKLKQSTSASNRTEELKEKISLKQKEIQNKPAAIEMQRKSAIERRNKQKEEKEHKEKELASHKAAIRTKRLLREIADSFRYSYY